MKYSEAKSQIKTGDVLLFKGHPLRSIYSAAIRIRTSSHYTHVGIACWMRTNGDRILCCIESREGVGVRVVPMDGYLEQMRVQWGRVDWYPIREDSLINREKVVAHAFARWQRLDRYPSWRKLLASFSFFVSGLRSRYGLDPDVDPSSVCCSELVAECLQHGGYDFAEAPVKHPAHTPPGVIAEYECLYRNGELELDVENATGPLDLMQDSSQITGASVIR